MNGPEPGDDITRAAEFALRFIGCLVLIGLAVVCGIGVVIGWLLS